MSYKQRQTSLQLSRQSGQEVCTAIAATTGVLSLTRIDFAPFARRASGAIRATRTSGCLSRFLCRRSHTPIICVRRDIFGRGHSRLLLLRCRRQQLRGICSVCHVLYLPQAGSRGCSLLQKSGLAAPWLTVYFYEFYDSRGFQTSFFVVYGFVSV